MYTSHMWQHPCALHEAAVDSLLQLCRPSMKCCTAGPSRLINGQLVSSSIDVYIVFEYCELGDLFHYRLYHSHACVSPSVFWLWMHQLQMMRLKDTIELVRFHTMLHVPGVRGGLSAALCECE